MQITKIHTVTSSNSVNPPVLIGHFTDEGHAKATAHKYNTSPSTPTNHKASVTTSHALETEDGYLLLKSAEAVKATDVADDAKAHLEALNSGLSKLTAAEKTALGIKS